MTFNPASVIYPNRLPPDPAAEAELAERTRQQEIEGLRRELAQVLVRREAVAAETPESGVMIVVDQSGADTGLRVTKVTAGLAREQIEEALRELDEQVEAIQRQLAFRNAAVAEVSGMPKVNGNVPVPKIGKKK